VATEAPENLLLDVLLTRMQAITGGPTYNTNPGVKAIGLPADAITPGSGQAIYVQHVSTQALPNQGSLSSHRMRAMYHAWCLADTDRAALNVKDDALRAVRTSEGSFSALAPYGMREGDCFTPNPEATVRGKSVRVQEFFADYEQTHT